VAAARRWLEDLLERVDALRRFPDSGRVVPNSGATRSVSCLSAPARVICRHRDGLVGMAVIRHQARHFDEDELAR